MVLRNLLLAATRRSDGEFRMNATQNTAMNSRSAGNTSRVRKPFGQGLLFTKRLKRRRAAPVVVVRRLSDPSAVLGRVSKVVVFAIQREPFAVSAVHRPIHEGFEVCPFIADSNAAGAVVGVCPVRHVQAARLHGVPYAIQSAVVGAVLDLNAGHVFALKASAGSGGTFEKAFCSGDGGAATFAN